MKWTEIGSRAGETEDEKAADGRTPQSGPGACSSCNCNGTNPIDISRPTTLDAIAAGTEIKIVTLDGNAIDADLTGLPQVWAVTSDTSVEILTAAFSRVLTQRKRLPEECANQQL